MMDQAERLRYLATREKKLTDDAINRRLEYVNELGKKT